MNLRSAVPVLCLISVAACSSGDIDTPDAGSIADAGDTTPDAGDTTPDAGDTTPDAGDITPDGGSTGLPTPEAASIALDESFESPALEAADGLVDFTTEGWVVEGSGSTFGRSRPTTTYLKEAPLASPGDGAHALRFVAAPPASNGFSLSTPEVATIRAGETWAAELSIAAENGVQDPVEISAVLMADYEVLARVNETIEVADVDGVFHHVLVTGTATAEFGDRNLSFTLNVGPFKQSIFVDRIRIYRTGAPDAQAIAPARIHLLNPSFESDPPGAGGFGEDIYGWEREYGNENAWVARWRPVEANFPGGIRAPASGIVIGEVGTRGATTTDAVTAKAISSPWVIAATGKRYRVTVAVGSRPAIPACPDNVLAITADGVELVTYAVPFASIPSGGFNDAVAQVPSLDATHAGKALRVTFTSTTPPGHEVCRTAIDNVRVETITPAP